MLIAVLWVKDKIDQLNGVTKYEPRQWLIYFRAWMALAVENDGLSGVGPTAEYRTMASHS